MANAPSSTSPQPQQNGSPPFKAHMSFEQASKLKMGDKVDYRQKTGRYALARVIATKSDCLFLRLDGVNPAVILDSMISCSMVNELDRLAEPRSISNRKAHRLPHIKKGAFVDVNISHQPGWRKAFVCDRKNGQIQVRYSYDVSGGLKSPIQLFTWIHLDNVDEVDLFGTHSCNKDIDHLPQLLETNRIYQQIPNDAQLRQLCAQRIMDNVYGGSWGLLSVLIKTASTAELQQIYKIIKQESIKYEDSHSQSKRESSASSLSLIRNASSNQKNSKNDTESAQMDEKSKIRSLSQLSRDSIVHICEFLNREDIKAFKLTSYRNGIVSLRQMTKCNIGVFEINQILCDEQEQFVDELGLPPLSGRGYKYHRYPANMSFVSLRHVWSEKYNVPLPKQLLLAHSPGEGVALYNQSVCEALGTRPLRNVPVRNFCLFDKRHIIMLQAADADKQSKAVVMDSLCCDPQKQRMVYVKWFDVFHQEILPLQFVMGEHEVITVGRVTRYLEKEFISTTSQQKQWHVQTLKTFKKMDNIAPTEPKLRAYKEYKNSALLASNPNEQITKWLIVTVQFNARHPLFSKRKFASFTAKFSLMRT